MKMFAFFLPQFHEIEENNLWWGEGFTEWTNVKKAKSLFKGHMQPIHPENDNYYNLLDKSTVIWQTEMMKSAGVAGMIYYHYYFCGRKLLEKPAENLLQWKDIDQPFFFCWANHTWNRAWKGSREVLLEQTYGDETDWRKHFEYLLPFFKDSRYEKKDNCPVFMIFRIRFDEKNKMMECFDRWCREEGFNGIHVIERVSRVLTKDARKEYEAKINYPHSLFVPEPDNGRNLLYNDRNWFAKKWMGVKAHLRKRGLKKDVEIYSGEKIFEHMIRSVDPSENCLRGLFFGWDNTPRHSYRGYIITPPSKESVFTYLNKIKDTDYVFINAWNEWAEGMILEPTKENGKKYLSWLAEYNGISGYNF